MQGAVSSECLCWKRSTGDGASGGHIRAREGETGGLCLSRSDLMRQEEAEPSQTPWEPLHNCPTGSY